MLGALQVELDSIAGVLAQRCQAGGRLDAGLLDDAQVACFELAWARADWVAARCAIDAPFAEATLERRLASTFAVDAITTLLARLDAVQVELGLSPGSRLALREDAAFRALRRFFTSAGALGDTAQAVVDRDARLAVPDLGGDLELLQQQMERFGIEQVTPLAARVHREDLTVPETLLESFRSMGLFGLSVPSRFGGVADDAQRDDRPMLIATEALSEASLGAAGSLITRPEILTRALLAGGSEAQCRRWLPGIAAGDPLCAIAITEPDHGSDVAQLGLRATRVAGGWHLDGAKAWCTFAGKAGVLMVLARTDPDRSSGYRGLTLMLAEKPSFEGRSFDYSQPTGGRLIGRATPTIGYRGMHSFELTFETFFVPDANVVGAADGIGRGFYYTMAGMVGGRLQTAARACGVMRGALRAGIDHARTRKVFGRTLLEYPLTQARIARHTARYAAARFLTFHAGRASSDGDAPMEASLAKLFACRAAEVLSRDMQQLHGAMGYAEETPASRHFVDARVLSIFEGAEETLALKVIARGLLDRAMLAQR